MTVRAGGRDAAGEGDDASQVVLGLGRETEHEVQLETPPPEPEDELGGLDELVLAVLLLDHVAEALRPGLGCERESRLPHPLDLGEQMRVQRIDARRRQGERNALWRDAIHELGEERIDAAVVARAE